MDVYGVKTVDFIMLLLFVILLQHSLKYQKFILAFLIKEKEKRAKKKETKTTVVSLKTHFLNKNQMLMSQNYLFVYTNQMFLYKAVHSCLVYSIGICPFETISIIFFSCM